MDQKITGLQGEAGDLLGSTLAVSGKTFMIGAPENDDAAGNAGTVLVFDSVLIEPGSGLEGTP